MFIGKQKYPASKKIKLMMYGTQSKITRHVEKEGKYNLQQGEELIKTNAELTQMLKLAETYTKTIIITSFFTFIILSRNSRYF